MIESFISREGVAVEALQYPGGTSSLYSRRLRILTNCQGGLPKVVSTVVYPDFPLIIRPGEWAVLLGKNLFILSDENFRKLFTDTEMNDGSAS